MAAFKKKLARVLPTCPLGNLKFQGERPAAAGVRQGDRWKRVADRGDGGAQADRQRLALEKERA